MISHHAPLPIAAAALLSGAVLIADVAVAAPFIPILADITVVTLVFLTLKKASTTAELVGSLPTRKEFEDLRALMSTMDSAITERVTAVLAGHQDDFGRRIERLEDAVYHRKGKS